MAAGICSMEFLVTQIMLVLREAIDGFRFSPTEEQLINHLKSEEPGRRGGFCIIPTLENINDFDPWDLPAKFSEKSVIPSNDREWWFICPQTQKPRISRKTPCGSSWKVTSGRTNINVDGQKMGYKRILSFPDGRGSECSKSNWVIHEYHLPDEDLRKNYILCHLMLKQDAKADNSTTRSEHGANDPAEFAELESCLNQPDDECSFPEHLIRARMESLMEPSQTQNGVQFSLLDLLQLFQRGLQSQYNGFCSTIHQSSLGTTKKDHRVDTMLNDLFYAEVQKGEEPSVEKVQQETAVSNIEPCIYTDETAARAKNGQISITENRRSKIEPLDCVVPLEETEGILQSKFHSSHLSEFHRIFASPDEPAAQEKGLEHEEHNLAGNSPKRRRLNMPEINQIQ